MAETVSFTALTRDAFRNIRLNRSLLWFALPVGILIASASYTAARAESLLTLLEGEAVFSFFLDGGGDVSFFFFLGLSLALTLAQAPLRGLIILLLQLSHLRDADPDQKPFQWKDYVRSLRIALVFELGFWGVSVCLASLLLAPTLLAWHMNREALPFTFQFGFILLIGIALYGYFIKELSLLYGLLGNLTPRSSLELGFRIFRRHSLLTLLYFTYLSILSLLATLSVAITVHLLLSFFTLKTNEFFEYFLALPFFGLYFIFEQSLKLAYFRKIATSPKSRLPKIPATKVAETVTGMTNI